LKSTITISVDTKVLEDFYRTCEKKGVSKSSILQQLIIEYLENGLRGDPQPSRKQHYDFDRSQKGSDD
jgi:metal-responsive CopG/Arc/MetJ family transcriptional regulator